MMVPHFFPGTPLGEEKMKEWRARQRQTKPEHSLNGPSSASPFPNQQICPEPLRRQSLLKYLWQCGLGHLLPGPGPPGLELPHPLLPQEPARKYSACNESPRSGKASRLTRRLPDQWFSNFPSKDHFCGQKTSWASHPTLHPADPQSPGTFQL